MPVIDLLTENTICGSVGLRPLPYHSKASRPLCSTRNPSVAVCGSNRSTVQAVPSDAANATSPIARGACDQAETRAGSWPTRDTGSTSAM